MPNYPVRNSVKALIWRDGKLLAVRIAPEGKPFYVLPGGGQELARKIIEDERARIKNFLDDNEELVKSCENHDTIPGRVRPRLINLSNCENVWISGLTLKNAPSWKSYRW